MDTPHKHTLDDYDANLLFAHLEIVIDHLRTVQGMASYLSRPVKETSRLWKNGSGQYETTAGFCFRDGTIGQIFLEPLPTPPKVERALKQRPRKWQR